MCDICGQEHQVLPMDIEAPYPADYYGVPPQEREERIFFTPDVCIIDNKVFILRGVLPLPVIGLEQDFRWGIWAIVEESEFARYVKQGDMTDVTNELPFPGVLSGGVPGLRETDLATVAVHVRPGGKRPLFQAVEKDSLLWTMQNEGVPLQYVHDRAFSIEQARKSKRERKTVRRVPVSES